MDIRAQSQAESRVGKGPITPQYCPRSLVGETADLKIVRAGTVATPAAVAATGT